MYGRYASTAGDAEIVDAFAVADIDGEELPPSWNVAPTQQSRVVLERVPRENRDAEPVRQLRSLTWSLVPSWAKEVELGR